MKMLGLTLRNFGAQCDLKHIGHTWLFCVAVYSVCVLYLDPVALLQHWRQLQHPAHPTANKQKWNYLHNEW